MTDAAYTRRATDHLPGECPGGCDDIKDVERRFKDGSDRMSRIESTLDTTRADVAEVLDILRLGKSFFRILGIFGTLVKWGAAVLAPIVAIVYTVKSGGKL
jgi:hypothetical protein